MDGFFFVGTNFCGLTKMTHSWGSKFVAIIFFFLIPQAIYYFEGTGIRRLDPPRKPRTWYPTKFKTFKVVCKWYVYKCTLPSISNCPPRLLRGSGMDCGLGDPGSIPGIPMPCVGPLMARRLKTSSDIPVPVSG